MSKKNLRLIGIIFLLISIAYPLNTYLQTGIPLKIILLGGADNYPALSELGFIIGVILVIVSFLRKKSK